MLAIEVNSLPIGEVMSDISKALQTEFTVNCDEFYLEIPSKFGEGSIKGVNFNGGLGILQYDCCFTDDVEFRFTLGEVHPLKFLYCLEGTLNHRFENSDETHEINQFQAAIVASDFFRGHILKFKSGNRTIVNSLEITRNEFQKKIQCTLVTMSHVLQELFNDIKAEKTFYHEGFYSLKLADLFREMQSFKGKDLIRKLFLEGKAYQMLTEQILQYEDDVFDSLKSSILRRSEVKQVEAAAKLIHEKISETNNITDIANEVGLSKNKLQEGFQNLYGSSINQYVQKVRLNLIKDLVLNTEYSMSEIVLLSGLSSKSYLSKIFKDEYGTVPSEYRKNFIDSLEKKRANLK